MSEEGSTVHRAFLPTYDECYVCGQSHPRGLRVRFSAGPDGRVHADFKPDSTQTGYEDIVHGGVISALMDELMGWSVVLQAERMAFTGELTIQFLKPVQAGRAYQATAQPGTNHGRHWESAGDLRGEDNRIYARARGKYFLLSEDQTAVVIERLHYRPGDMPVLQKIRREAEAKTGEK